MKKQFLTGLVILLPVAITVWFATFLVRFLTTPFMGFVKPLLEQVAFPAAIRKEEFIRILSELLILVCLAIVILLLGFCARKFFFKPLIRLGDALLDKIPIVRKIYRVSKDIIQSLLKENGRSFQQVVLIPYPYKGSFCLGLLTSENTTTCDKDTGKEMLSVFLPSAPNPTTGYLILAAKEDLIYLSMKPDEAIKYVISCAVIQPEERIS
jgi:uncharacterized membrane protein